MASAAQGGSDERAGRRLTLRAILVATTTAQIVLTGGIVAYLSLRNGQHAVGDLVRQLQREVSASVEQNLVAYLETPHAVNQSNADLLRAGFLDEGDLASLRFHFWQQLGLFGAAAYVQLGRADGQFVGVERNQDGTFNVEITDLPLTGKGVWRLDSDGEPSGEPLDFVRGYDCRTRPWYRAAVEQGRPTWSTIYQFSSRDAVRLGITAVQPHYDDSGELVGVLGTDIALSQLSGFLRSPRIEPGGRIFVEERSGLLVASSFLDQPFAVDASGTAERLRASGTADPFVATAARVLEESPGGLEGIQEGLRFDLGVGGERAFVEVSPFRDGRGIDWLIVVVLPEEDFMAEIEANTRFTLVLCLAALLLAILVAIWISRRLSEPVLKLGEVAQALSRGDWEVPVPRQRTAELEALAEAFAEMRTELASAQRRLWEYSRDLERTVAERTRHMREAVAARALAERARGEAESARSEAERARADAEFASRAKSEFLANMSHELRTPLNAIMGYSDLLIEEMDRLAPDQVRSDLGRILASGRHLLGLVDLVLDLTRVEAGRMTVEPERFEVAGLVEEARAMVLPMIDRNENAFDVEYPADIGSMTTDRRKLAQCILNLLSNAAKFTHRGSVRLTVLREPDPQGRSEVVFRVRDTGIGIPEDRIQDLFEPFVQLDASTTREYGGTGLGLAVTERFCRLLGGSVVARSAAGAGSTFEVRIPDPWRPAGEEDGT